MKSLSRLVFWFGLAALAGCHVENSDNRDLTKLQEERHLTGSDTCAVDSASVKASALHLAAFAGDMAVLEASIHTPAEANQLTSDTKFSPLLCAVAGGQVDAARWLLGKGGDSDLADSTGKTPLFLALQRGNKVLAELLIPTTKNPEVIWEKETLLTLALRIKDADTRHAVLTPLLASGAKKVLEYNIYGEIPSALASASYGGDLASVQALIAAGANPVTVDRSRLSEGDITRALDKSTAPAAKLVKSAFGKHRETTTSDRVGEDPVGSLVLVHIDGNSDLDTEWRQAIGSLWDLAVGLAADSKDAAESVKKVKQRLIDAQSNKAGVGSALPYLATSELIQFLDSQVEEMKALTARKEVLDLEKDLARAFRDGDGVTMVSVWNKIQIDPRMKEERFRDALLERYSAVIDEQGLLRGFGALPTGLVLKSEAARGAGSKLRHHVDLLALAHGLLEIVAAECLGKSDPVCQAGLTSREAAERSIRDVEIAVSIADASAAKRTSLWFDKIEAGIAQRTGALEAVLLAPFTDLDSFGKSVAQALDNIDMTSAGEVAAKKALSTGLLEDEKSKSTLGMWSEDLKTLGTPLDASLQEITDAVVRARLQLGDEKENVAGAWSKEMVRAAMETLKQEAEKKEKEAAAAAKPKA